MVVLIPFIMNGAALFDDVVESQNHCSPPIEELRRAGTKENLKLRSEKMNKRNVKTTRDDENSTLCGLAYTSFFGRSHLKMFLSYDEELRKK